MTEENWRHGFVRYREVSYLVWSGDGLWRLFWEALVLGLVLHRSLHLALELAVTGLEVDEQLVLLDKGVTMPMLVGMP